MKTNIRNRKEERDKQVCPILIIFVCSLIFSFLWTICPCFLSLSLSNMLNYYQIAPRQFNLKSYKQRHNFHLARAIWSMLCVCIQSERWKGIGNRNRMYKFYCRTEMNCSHQMFSGIYHFPPLSSSSIFPKRTQSRRIFSRVTLDTELAGYPVE